MNPTDRPLSALPLKPYQTPHIEIYGNLSQLTQTVNGGTGAQESGGGNPNHFTTH